MSRFAIAFVTPSDTAHLIHSIVEDETRDLALRKFFSESVSEFYSNDEQGFHYFKDDFFDDQTPTGSIIALQ